MSFIPLPITDPTWIFFVVLGVILFTPMLLERLRVPSIVGLIVVGVVIGPHGVHLLNRDASFEIFGKVGLYYIMFMASLSMNLTDVMRHRYVALAFGLISFALPFALGLGVNVWGLGMSWPAGLLVASMYAAHTLLTYPVHQAADILFCQANLVPVGKDQLPHLEQARLIAQRFDKRYGRAVKKHPVFRRPEALLSEAPLLLGLDGEKMSKSRGNTIELRMSADETAKALKKAKTDSERHITYDPKVISLDFLLGLYFKSIDPTSINKQGNDRGSQYRTGVYYTDPADLPTIKKVFEEEQKQIHGKIAVEVKPLKNFYTAEEYHQDYLDKHPTGYCHLPAALFEYARKAKMKK